MPDPGEPTRRIMLSDGTSWSCAKEDKKYLNMLDRMEPKSPCVRAKIAAIAVKDGKVLAKAVNHPYKFYDLKKLGCIPFADMVIFISEIF